MSAPTTAILVKGWPRLSETFIARELLALQDAGLAFRIVSLRRPTDPAVHPIHRRIRAPVTYLPEYVHQEPRRVMRALAAVLRDGRLARVLPLFFDHLWRDPTPNRLRRLAQASVLAYEHPELRRLHVHYLHTPASVGLYAARMLAIPFSLSAHAKDIWTTPAWEKRAKLEAAAFTVTCTRTNRDHLQALAPRARVELVYHGLDLADMPPPPARPARTGDDPADPVRFVCIARAVAKKGLDVLLEALARLPPELHWRLLHIGDGSERPRLEQLAARLQLQARVDFRGARPRADVIAALQEGDVFVLPARIAPDGDRDGLPNVLLEAASQELAILTTPISAIPEFIRHRREGLLVPPEDPEALAEALLALARDPALRLRLGRAARARLVAEFRFEAHIPRLLRHFGLKAPMAAAVSA